jgi:eukaryotic-like serine/threonine-protein kinase
MIRYFVVSRLFYGLACGLAGGLAVGLQDGLVLGLSNGLGIGLVFGLNSPASFVIIKHYSLRFLLYRHDNLPLKLIPFLDAMVDRLLLRRIGGGYIFIHRTLMDHFSSLSEEELDTMVMEIVGGGSRQ